MHEMKYIIQAEIKNPILITTMSESVNMNEETKKIQLSILFRQSFYSASKN